MWHIDGNRKQWLIHRGTWMQPRYNQILKHYSLQTLQSIIVEKTHKPSISYIAFFFKSLSDLLQYIFFPLIIIWLFCQIMAKNAGNFFFFYCIWTLSKVLGSGKYFMPSSSMFMPSNFQLVYKPMCILNEMNTYILDSFTLNSPRWFRRHPINLWFLL